MWVHSFFFLFASCHDSCLAPSILLRIRNICYLDVLNKFKSKILFSFELFKSTALTFFRCSVRVFPFLRLPLCVCVLCMLCERKCFCTTICLVGIFFFLVNFIKWIFLFGLCCCCCRCHCHWAIFLRFTFAFLCNAERNRCVGWKGLQIYPEFLFITFALFIARKKLYWNFIA